MPQQQPGSYQGSDDDEMSVSLEEETRVPGGNHRPMAYKRITQSPCNYSDPIYFYVNPDSTFIPSHPNPSEPLQLL